MRTVASSSGASEARCASGSSGSSSPVTVCSSRASTSCAGAWVPRASPPTSASDRSRCYRGRIGLVTSGEGAARADFLTNVAKRFPAANVLVVRSLVQGEGAPAEIVRAIGYLDGQPDVDVIVLARGGGPLEDLMAFNSEAVCRAVAAPRRPSCRPWGTRRTSPSATSSPTSASPRQPRPPRPSYRTRPSSGGSSIAASSAMSRADATGDRDERPAARLRDVPARTVAAVPRRRGGCARPVALDAARPALLANARQAPIAVAAAHDRLVLGARAVLSHAGNEVERIGALHALLSPSRTVARGYAIVRDQESGRVIAERAATVAGQQLAVELRDGIVDVRVEDTGIETR